MKCDSSYPVTANVFKSSESITSNGSCNTASPCQSFTVTNRWKQYKMYVDLSTWTLSERTNMRISIRPNTTTALPNGPYPKTFWFDDITFKPVDSLSELKDMAISVATDRMYLSIDSGYTTEANNLKTEIANLSNTNLSYPLIPVRAVGFFPAPTQTNAATNPFINALNGWAATYLTQTFTSFPKSTPGNFVFPNGYDARTLAETAENLHWLIVSPYSGYRYHPELFRRFLTILYATSEDYKYNGMEPYAIPGTNNNAINDWFAAKKMSNVWRMADTSFGAFLVPTFKQILYDARDTMGKLFNAFAQSIDTYQYTNRDISYAEVLMNIGLMQNNSAWINMSKRMVDTINLVARQLDGAYLYYQKQNETINYHGGTNSSLSRIWAVSGYQPAWDCVSKTAMYEIFSLEGNANPEFNTAPAWHTQWNGGYGTSPEALISITQNKYLKARYNKIRKNIGYVDDMPSSVAFYNSSIPTAIGLPDNYVCYDRNIKGFRGRYGNFSYTATTRNVAIPTNQPGLQTIVGAMEGYTNVNGKDSLDAALMSVHSKVHVKNSTVPQQNTDWGFMMANNTTPKVNTTKIASSVSISGQLQYYNSGPSGVLTNWSSYQQWITLPDRIIGVVETYPTNNAVTQAFEIDGRVRFTYGRAISTPKYLITDVAGSQYRYGRFKAIIHAHDFTQVLTDTAGVVLDSYRNAMEIIFRYNLSNGSNLYSYPANTKKYFIIEVRDSNAVGNATVTRDISTSGVRGLIVKLNGKSYASYRNDNTSNTSVDLTNAVVSGNTNQVHFSRGDSLINRPVLLSSTSYTIPANEQILLVSTNTPFADTGRGWQNYPELLAMTDSFSTTQNGAWNVNATWQANDTPQAYNNALINHNVTLASSATINNLTINSGDTLSIASNQTLTVNGGLVNNGTINGDGCIILTATPVSGNGIINNVTVNSAAGIVLNGKQTLTGVLTPTLGSVFTNNNLTLASSATNTASIAAGSGIYISGNVTLQRYISSRRAFRFLGHPFSSGISLTQLTSTIDITGGNGNSQLGFTPSGTNTASALWFNSSLGNGGTVDAGWTAFTDLTQSSGANGWNRYKGINVLIRGAKGEGLTGQSYSPSSVILSLQGTLNIGTQVVGLDNSGTGWNLIGNPYPSSINLQNVLSRSGINSGVYVWNALAATRGIYQAVPAASSYILPSASAIMVKSTTSGQSLVFNESDKTTASEVALFGIKDGIQIDLLKDGNFYDRAYLINNANASSQKDKYDLEKFLNSSGSIFIIASDSSKLSIDARPLALNQPFTIPISLVLKDTGKYTISFNDVNIVNTGTCFLHDKLLSKYESISNNRQYEFNVAFIDTLELLNRFEITNQQKNIVQIDNSPLGFEVTSSPNQWTIYYKNSSDLSTNICLYALDGKIIKTYSIGNLSYGTIIIDKTQLPQSIYFLSMKSIESNIVKKLIK
jgi:hypothetical protein